MKLLSYNVRGGGGKGKEERSKKKSFRRGELDFVVSKSQNYMESIIELGNQFGGIAILIGKWTWQKAMRGGLSQFGIKRVFRESVLGL